MSLETNLNKIHQTAYGIAHGELGEFAATSRPRLVCYHQQRWPTRRWSRPHITAQGHCMCHPGQGCQIHQKQEWSMKFCYSCFHVQIHKPLVHDSQPASIYHQRSEASLLELRGCMTLRGLEFPYCPNTTGWPPLVFQGLAPMDQLSKSRTKTHLQATYRTPPNAPTCPPLVFTGSNSSSQ